MLEVGPVGENPGQEERGQRVLSDTYEWRWHIELMLGKRAASVIQRGSTKCTTSSILILLECSPSGVQIRDVVVVAGAYGWVSQSPGRRPLVPRGAMPSKLVRTHRFQYGSYYANACGSARMRQGLCVRYARFFRLLPIRGCV
jgi:hypothetical protein